MDVNHCVVSVFNEAREKYAQFIGVGSIPMLLMLYRNRCIQIHTLHSYLFTSIAAIDGLSR